MAILPTPRVLVTGAAGFIGSHTVDRLLQMGCTVIGVDDLSRGNRDNLNDAFRSPLFRFERLDVVDEAAFEALCAEMSPDSIVHLAGLVSVDTAESDPMLNYWLNYHATRTVLEVARRHGISRIVFSSSAAVYGNDPARPVNEDSPTRPIGLYGRAKLFSERLLENCAERDDPTTIRYRYFNVYGPRQDPSSPYSGVISIFANRLSRGLPVRIFGDGEQSRDFISVFDVAEANALAATRARLSSGTYNICTGRSMTIRELCAVLRTHFPQTAPPKFASPRRADIRHSVGDPSRASGALGFQSRISMEDGIRQLVESMSENTPAEAESLVA